MSDKNQLVPHRTTFEDLPIEVHTYFSDALEPHHISDLKSRTELGGPIIVDYGGGAALYSVPFHRSIINDGGLEGNDSAIYLVEFDGNAQKTGFGSVRKDSHSASGSHAEPYVGYTETINSLVRQGYGTRRLITMNVLSKLVFGEVIYSDPDGFTTVSAARVWEKLVNKGLAEEAKDNKNRFRWRFVE